MMGIIPTSLWLLGNLLHLCRSHDFNTYPQHNIRLNNHLRLDAWFMLLIGATYLAFPTQIVGFIVCESLFTYCCLYINMSFVKAIVWPFICISCKRCSQIRLNWKMLPSAINGWTIFRFLLTPNVSLDLHFLIRKNSSIWYIHEIYKINISICCFTY